MVRKNQINYLSAETKRVTSQLATLTTINERQSKEEECAARQEERDVAHHKLRMEVMSFHKEYYMLQIQSLKRNVAIEQINDNRDSQNVH